MKNWKIEVKLTDNNDGTMTLSDLSSWPHAIVKASEKDFEIFVLSLMVSAKAEGGEKIEQVNATNIGEETLSLMLLADIAKTRFDMLEKEGFRDIWEFNKAFPNIDMLPIVACFSDMDGILANEIMTKTLLHMIQTTRAVGIHIIILDKKGAKRRIPAEMGDNCPVKISIANGDMDVVAPKTSLFKNLKANGRPLEKA